jgi:hypothetical protein
VCDSAVCEATGQPLEEGKKEGWHTIKYLFDFGAKCLDRYDLFTRILSHLEFLELISNLIYFSSDCLSFPLFQEQYRMGLFCLFHSTGPL